MKFPESTDSHLTDDLKKENDILRRKLEELESRYDFLKKEHTASRNINPSGRTDEKVLENEKTAAGNF